MGFAGGHTPAPTYQQVCTKTTGHAEVVQVTYRPNLVSTATLLQHFFLHHDPGVDRRPRGGQYRSIILYTTDAQRQTASQMLTYLRQHYAPVYTELVAATPFYAAEGRHQQYCTARGLTPTARQVGLSLDFWTS